MLDDITTGMYMLRNNILKGSILYVVIFLLLLMRKDRRKFQIKNLFELFFCIYFITMLDITGIFELHIDLEDITGGFVFYNAVPFIGCSAIMVFLNFILFIPFGFLLSGTFSINWNWKKVTLVGGCTSFCIEFLQFWGGRFPEIDDLIINTFGALSGYIIYQSVVGVKENIKKSIVYVAILCTAAAIGFTGIYFVSNKEKPQPDGLDAVEEYLSGIRFYHNGQWMDDAVDGDIYMEMLGGIQNCGHLVLEKENTEHKELFSDTDYYIELSYTKPQTIHFENEDFTIENAKKLLYNTSTGQLYWGDAGYQNVVNYRNVLGEDVDFETYLKEEDAHLKEMVMKKFE